MKRNQILTLFGALLVSITNLIGQLTLSPENIIAEEKVTITYDPQGTVLESEEEIVINIFQFNNKEFETVEIPMRFETGKFTGSFTTAESTKVVLFEVTNVAMDKKDNNDEKGYKTMCFDSDRITPIEGAYASSAYSIGWYSWILGLDADTEEAMKLLEKEFTNYPASEKNIEYQYLHLNLADSNKDETAVEEHSEKVAQILKSNNATKDELSYVYSFSRIRKDEVGMKKIKSQSLLAYPTGSFARIDAHNSIEATEDIAEKVAIYEAFSEKFGNTEDTKWTENYMLGKIAFAYLKVADMDNFRKFFSLLDNRTNKARSLNEAAWTMSGESLKGESKTPAIGLQLSKQSLELLEAEMNDMASQSEYETKRKYERNLKNAYAMYADTYALLAYKNGNIEEALKYQTISCENNDFNSSKETERYCVYFENVHSPEETEALLANFIENGKATPIMKEQHMRLYMANNTMESAYNKYTAQLGKAASAKKRVEIKESMINLPAPNFDLLNLDGRQINLEDLKGKVVVVDFWATWCGPCISSFPGMQKAVNKFEKSDDVAFVFIDTWESGEEITEEVAKFIESNSYSFNVLMDLEGKVVDSFGVNSIPTKFVIDKEGVIRFRSEGFAGNDDTLMTEIIIMIELAGGTLPANKTSKP